MNLDTIDGFRRRTFTHRQIEAIRTRASLHLAPTTAADVGMTYEALVQFANFTSTPDDNTLWKLAKRLKVFEKVTR